MSETASAALVAERVVRAVASATNLIYAGASVGVLGGASIDDEVVGMLKGFGARVHEPSSEAAITILFVTECAVLAEALGAPGLVEDAIVALIGAESAGLSNGAIAGADVVVGAEVRPGVHRIHQGERSFFIVPIDPGIVPPTGPGAAQGRPLVPVPDAVARGAARIDWARRFMHATMGLSSDLAASKRLAGYRVGVSLVLEPKTAVLALALAEAGAEVAVFASSGETDSEVASALATMSITVFASADAGADGDARHAAAMLAWAPQLLIDDGAHLVRLAHTEHPEARESLIGAAEETTSGVRPLREMAEEGALRLPVIAVNDARTKTLFDNVYGTGQSCVLAIADLVDAAGLRGGAVRGGRWVVVGYGPVGVGVARHATAMGARITVVERDPVRALGALHDGYDVDTLNRAVASADVVVSATGHAETITVEALTAAADGCVVAVAGGVENEIELGRAIAEGFGRSSMLAHVDRLHRPGRGDIVLLADGDGVNYTAGEGNPIEIMDLSFATQIEALRMLLDSIDSSGTSTLSPGVHELGMAGETAVARAALEARGVAVEAPRPDATAGKNTTWRAHRYRNTSGH